MLPIRTILHPTDFSEHADFAFQLACAIARDYDAGLMIVHVAEVPNATATEGLLLYSSEFDLEPLRQRLEQVRPKNSDVPVKHRLIEGDAAAGILAAAKDSRSDLIVMGTHGRSGLSRMLMGSVAEQVVRKAPCPVLTLKEPIDSSSHVEEVADTSAAKD